MRVFWRVYWGIAFVLGLLVCAFDWSGFNTWNPDIFSPEPLTEVWWHFPIEMGVVVGVFELILACPKCGLPTNQSWSEK